MQWYYSKNGTQLGPIGADEITAKVASGEIAPTDLVWREGMGDWLPSAQVSELRAAAAPAAAPVSATTPISPDAPAAPVGTYGSPEPSLAPAPVAPNVYAPPVTQQPTGYNPGMVAPVSGKATTAMVLGICGIVFAICCWPVGIVLAILAVVFGNQSKTEIAQNPHLIASLGKAKAGVLMGWISLGLAILFALLHMLSVLGNFGTYSTYR